jgi:serine protease Do
MKKALSIVALATLGGLIALGITRVFEKKSTNQGFEAMQNVMFTKGDKIAEFGGKDFVEVANLSTPAVVHIKTTVDQSGSGMDDLPFGFREFFGDRMPQMPRGGSGSGVIITKDGYIVTNNHVIEGASKIEVILNDKRSYYAELVGNDPETDLALLKIEDKDLAFMPFGNSDALNVGEWVVAVGNPFNLTSTVTAGIVSAKGRNINIIRRSGGDYAIENFIQTDAAVNPGNSGGALVNTKGELIGINTAIASQTGSYAGYAFAIPINLAKKILDDLLKFGEVKRAILGVRIQDIDQSLSTELDLKTLNGVYVPSVTAGGAADKGGIKDGDVIIAIDNVKVDKSSELQEVISKYYPGDKVDIKIIRKGKEQTIPVVLLSRDGEKTISSKKKTETKKFLGATFQTVDKETRDKFKIAGGVEVTSVSPGVLKNKGIKQGFIITHIDKTPVNTAQDLERILKNKKGAVLIEGIDEAGNKEVYAIMVD